MANELFQNLITELDKEIKAYTALKDLFLQKRELLKQAKPDDLGILDNKIIALRNSIEKLNKTREGIAVRITGENANMSRFIEYAKQTAPEYVQLLEERKVKICNIIPEIMLLNQQNVELLKHGIAMTDKMLETIVNAFAPQGSYYNGAGKTDTHEIDMWTINEEI